jgi:hypothetical protein
VFVSWESEGKGKRRELKREETNLDLKLEAMRILNLSKRGGGIVLQKEKGIPEEGKVTFHEGF